MWHLPLPDRLREQLKSEIADMRNTGDRYGGALTAGLFLKEFVGDTPWVHVDIAGPASADKETGHVGQGRHRLRGLDDRRVPRRPRIGAHVVARDGLAHRNRSSPRTR